jgi:two-component system response regulator RegA
MNRILIIDDDTAHSQTLTVAFAREGWSISWRTRAADGLDALGEDEFSAVAVAASLPDRRGLELCAELRKVAPELPVIFLAGDGGAGLQTAVEAMRAGAVDFIAKPIAADEMVSAVNRAVQRRDSSVTRALESSQIVPIDELERRYIHLVMEAVDGNKTQAAKLLGLDRTTLYRKLGRYQELDKNGLVESERALPSRLI